MKGKNLLQMKQLKEKPLQKDHLKKVVQLNKVNLNLQKKDGDSDKKNKKQNLCNHMQGI